MNLTREQFWSRVKQLEGLTIWTISRNKPNRLLEDTSNKVIIPNRTTAPTQNDLYSTYVLLDSGETVTTGHIARLKAARVSRICLAIVAQAASDEVEIVSSGKKTGIRRRSP